MDKSEHVQGFKVYLFQFRKKSTTQHHVFFKEHSVREKILEKPTDRTLFLANVPPYCSEECLKRVFDPCGTVVSVFFHEKPNSSIPPTEESLFFPKHKLVKGFKVAYVVFLKASGLHNALKLDTTKPLILSTKTNPIVTGLNKWCQEYNAHIPNLDALETEVTAYITKFDKLVANKAWQEKEGLTEDDDGWMTVTRKGRNPGFARTESVSKKIMEKEGVKRQKKELLNFYTFQIREGKMRHLVNLRQKFEEDKKRIAALKSSRRFKPF